MGVNRSPGVPLAPGADQDALLRQVTDEMQEKGFVVAQSTSSSTGRVPARCGR